MVLHSTMIAFSCTMHANGHVHAEMSCQHRKKKKQTQKPRELVRGLYKCQRFPTNVPVPLVTASKRQPACAEVQRESAITKNLRRFSHCHFLLCTSCRFPMWMKRQTVSPVVAIGDPPIQLANGRSRSDKRQPRSVHCLNLHHPWFPFL